MARSMIWIPAFAIVAICIAASPDPAKAGTSKGTTAGQVGEAKPLQAKGIKRQGRRVDDSVTTCRMFGSDGLTPRPGLMHMKQSDHARLRAENDLIEMSQRGNGDEAAYYRSLTGNSADNPKLNRYRVADRLGMKKACKPYWSTP